MTKKLIFINIFLVIILLIFSSKLNADINLDSVFLEFSKENFFGTDDLGRDVFSLIIIGGFRTLEVVAIATSLSFFVGSFLGMIAGYFERNIGTIIKSTVDLMMVVPTLIVALIITSIFGITPVTAGISLGIFGIGNYMNQSEALTKAEKNKDYILASKLLGVPWYVVLFKRIFVNILARLLVNLGNTASGVILQYSALTFIGLGSDYTKPDWGAMLYQPRRDRQAGQHPLHRDQRGKDLEGRYLSGGSGRLWHPRAGRPRLRRHRAGRRRPGAHRQAAGLRRRSAEPACLCGLEGYARCRASGGAVHGAHRERVQLFHHCGGKLSQPERRSYGRKEECPHPAVQGQQPVQGRSVRERQRRELQDPPGRGGGSAA